MGCGYTTSGHMEQSDAHTRAHMVRLPRGPYQRLELFFLFWQQINLKGKHMALFSHFSVILRLFSLQKPQTESLQGVVVLTQ